MQHALAFTAHIRRPVTVVYEHLAQPASFIGLQPLLTSIASVQEIQVEGRRGCRYETVETFRIGPIPVLNNRIRVRTVLTEPDVQIDSVVHSQPDIRLDVRYRFTSQGEETDLVEQMRITAPAWVGGYVVRTARRVQEQTLANPKQRPETGDEGLLRKEGMVQPFSYPFHPPAGNDH
jgi:hypothetical protein